MTPEEQAGPGSAVTVRFGPGVQAVAIALGNGHALYITDSGLTHRPVLGSIQRAVAVARLRAAADLIASMEVTDR